MKSRSWQDLEKLVASIENHLKPKGAIVKYSHRRKEKDGHPREVDATIEYKIGSVPILIIVECRDWASKQNKTWIEQLVTKRENVGAQQVIAVSTSGFTNPAIEEAKKRSIELRLLNEITEEVVQSWTKGIEAKAIKESRRIKQFQIFYYDEEGRSFQFTKDTIDEIRKNMVNTPIMTRYSDDQEITLQHIVDGVLQHTRNNQEAMQEDYKKALFGGDPFEERITLTFPKGQYYNMYEGDKIDVQKIQIDNFVTFDVFDDIPIRRILSYTDVDGNEFDQLALLEYEKMTMHLRQGNRIIEEE